MAGPTTVIIWYYSQDLTASGTIFERVGSSSADILLYVGTSRRWTNYCYRSAWEAADTGYYSANEWNMVAVKMSTAETSALRNYYYSINGAPFSAKVLGSSTTPIASAGPIKICSGLTGTMETGYIAQVLVYDRELSDSEIQDNWDALKDRYGKTSYGGLVESGLLFHLDSDNPQSYPGSGSVWTDLASGIVMTAQGGVLNLVSNVGGSTIKAFQMDGAGYFLSDSNQILFNMAGPTTVIIWYYSQDLTASGTIFERVGSSSADILLYVGTSRRWTNYCYRSAWEAADTGYYSANEWNMVAVKMSTAETSALRNYYYSINGAPFSAKVLGSSTTPIASAGPIKICSGLTGTMETGYIAQVLVYDRELSDSEIQDNWDALKDRYGKN